MLKSATNESHNRVFDFDLDKGALSRKCQGAATDMLLYEKTPRRIIG